MNWLFAIILIGIFLNWLIIPSTEQINFYNNKKRNEAIEIAKVDNENKIVMNRLVNIFIETNPNDPRLSGCKMDDITLREVETRRHGYVRGIYDTANGNGCSIIFEGVMSNKDDIHTLKDIRIFDTSIGFKCPN